MREFEGITKNAMTIHPPMKKHEVDGFDLTIEKFNVLKTIQENRDPCDVENLDKDKDTLWNGRIQYSEHRSYLKEAVHPRITIFLYFQLVLVIIPMKAKKQRKNKIKFQFNRSNGFHHGDQDILFLLLSLCTNQKKFISHFNSFEEM